MNLSNYYYYFQSAIPHRLCDDIIRLGKDRKEAEKIGMTGGMEAGRDMKKNPLSKKELKDLRKLRDSNITWMSDPWLYNLIHPFIHSANIHADWNYTWDSSEACQFTKYSKGQYYGWHCDTWDKKYKDQKVRKLSVTVTLSDPSEYEGGDLEFDFRNVDPDKKRNVVVADIKPKGSIVIFPSFVWHRVKPVKSGTRYSLVIWNLGYMWQ